MSNNHTLDQERLVNTREAAGMLAKHTAVLADWRHQSRGPKCVKYGRSIRYRIGDLHEWVAENTVEPAAK